MTSAWFQTNGCYNILKIKIVKKIRYFLSNLQILHTSYPPSPNFVNLRTLRGKANSDMTNRSRSIHFYQELLVSRRSDCPHTWGNLLILTPTEFCTEAFVTISSQWYMMYGKAGKVILESPPGMSLCIAFRDSCACILPEWKFFPTLCTTCWNRTTSSLPQYLPLPVTCNKREKNKCLRYGVQYCIRIMMTDKLSTW